MSKVKNPKTSSFPIASILFLLCFATYALIMLVLVLSDAYFDGFVGYSFGFPLIFSLLLAFFTSNTTKKPSIFYLLVLLVFSFGQFIVPIAYRLSTFFTYEYMDGVSAFLIALGLCTDFIYLVGILVILVITLLVAVFKKTVKLFKFWFLFPIPLILGLLCDAFVSVFDLFVTISKMGIEHAAPLLTFGSLIFDTFLVGAFFATSYQYAKVNKNLSLPEDIEDDFQEDTEITE